ncbi:MAG: hypothetical protein CMP10_20245 [Zetaproteobacteria bacterium]|nr:hypothetical protein [Pseudobdellovibrionaceae bacterium]
MPSDLAIKAIMLSCMAASTVSYAVRVPQKPSLDTFTLWLGRFLGGMGFIGYFAIGDSLWLMNFALTTCILTYILSLSMKHCMIELLCSPMALLASMSYLLNIDQKAGSLWAPILSSLGLISVMLVILVYLSKGMPRTKGPRWSFYSFPRFGGP